MKNSDFWVLHKGNSKEASIPVGSRLFGETIPEWFIVEVTPDELVYIWPENPNITALCKMCEKQADCSDAFNGHVYDGHPCEFLPAPAAVPPQDLDDFLLDGEFIAQCGYFHSFQDFMKQIGFADVQFDSFPLGELPSIRKAREVFRVTRVFNPEALDPAALQG